MNSILLFNILATIIRMLKVTIYKKGSHWTVRENMLLLMLIRQSVNQYSKTKVINTEKQMPLSVLQF